MNISDVAEIGAKGAEGCSACASVSAFDLAEPRLVAGFFSAAVESFFTEARLAAALAIGFDSVEDSDEASETIEVADFDVRLAAGFFTDGDAVSVSSAADFGAALVTGLRAGFLETADFMASVSLLTSFFTISGALQAACET